MLRCALTTFVALILLVPTSALAQEELDVSEYCDYISSTPGKKLFEFESDDEAKTALTQVMRHVGLKPNFEIRAANVSNAAAVLKDKKRLILYNQQFMIDITKQTQSKWANLSILVHELGHHLQGHTLEDGGSRPKIELEADYYSGFVLQQMGATLEQAKLAMNKLAPDQGSETHPAKDARLAAIVNGWIAAQDLTKLKVQVDAKPPIEEMPKEVKEDLPLPDEPKKNPGEREVDKPQPPQRAEFVYRVVFPNDPRIVLVSANDELVEQTPYGMFLVGKKVPPAPIHQQFQWMLNFTSQGVVYGVDDQGRVWTRDAQRGDYQIGHLARP